MSKELLVCSSDGCNSHVNIVNDTGVDYVFDMLCDGQIQEIIVRALPNGNQEG